MREIFTSMFSVGRSMFDVPLLVSCLWILTSQKSQAIVDANNNGLSDLWEKANNGGELFPSTFDPQADPDGDGWTNAGEAAAGTHPFDPNPPDGFIRPKLEHSPAVYITGANGPELLSPEAYVLTWPTRIGKQYTLLFSADLAEGSWVPVGDPAIATETEALAGVTIAQPDGTIPPAIFWRVAVSDTDSDGDTLTDHEEYLLGTNPYSADTDSDGTPDAGDPDTFNGNAGNLPPGGGNSGGTSDDGPPEVIFLNYSRKDYHESCLAHPPDPYDPAAVTTYEGFTYGESRTINRVITSDPTYPDVNIHTTLTSVLSGLAEVDFPPLETIYAENLPQGSNCAEHGYGPVAFCNFEDFGDGDDSTGVGSAATSRFWLERLHPENKVRSLTYLKLYGRFWWGELTAIGSVKLEIPANDLHSNEVELTTEDNDSWIRLARFSIRDNKFATGVDNVSNSVADIAGSGYQDMPWIMAPCQGTSASGVTGFTKTNDVVINIGSAISGPIKMTCPDGMVTPGEVTGVTGEDIIRTSWKGTGNTSGDKIPVFKFGTGADQISVELPVRVKVMKKRDVKVVVHYVTRARKDPGTGVFTDLRPPETMPSKESIIQKLNTIYGAQINAWFSNLEVVHETTDWDSGMATNWGSAAYPIPTTYPGFGAFNRSLDMGGNDEASTGTKPEQVVEFMEDLTSVEEQKLLELKAPDSAAVNIDVFIVGGCDKIRTVGAHNGQMYEIESGLGRTKGNRRTCFISGGKPINSGTVALAEDKLLYTIAHEIGHVIIGKGHPDRNSGPAPLDGTIKEKRLMFSDLISKKSSGWLDYNLLVKAEWDAAEI